MSINAGSYIDIKDHVDEKFAFCIEDPITEHYNEGLSIQINSLELGNILSEFDNTLMQIEEKGFEKIMENFGDKQEMLETLARI